MDQPRLTKQSAYTHTRSVPCRDKRPDPPSVVARLQTCRPSRATRNQTRRRQTLLHSRWHLQRDCRPQSLHPRETAHRQHNHCRSRAAPHDKLRAASERDSLANRRNHPRDRFARSKTLPSCTRAHSEAQLHQTPLRARVAPPPQRSKAALAAARECVSSACQSHALDNQTLAPPTRAGSTRPQQSRHLRSQETRAPAHLKLQPNSTVQSPELKHVDADRSPPKNAENI